LKVGLFFGSFNPIHIGHLIIANSMKELTDLDQVWFVVSPLSPFKSSKSLLPDIDRLRMVELAIADNYDLMASNIEFGMPRPSYTIDTLAYLTDRHPKYQFKVILGEDNLTHFHKWKNHEEILNTYGLYIYPRPATRSTEKIKALKSHASVKVVEAPLIDISATFIRDCVSNDISIKYLVHDHVADYIRGNKLFL
jgi:nicotinate-nucleotide adenylyltransferase